ncbi:GNAT family N-acetyltransferase [Lysinibacillus sp. SGAir0095]|nr:GNAT family N-acetyltransferase [Lysinibacillus sp. SGAir0095]
MGDLGYPTSQEQMKTRFNNMEAARNHHTLVADDEGKVVGMIGFHTGVLYSEDGIYARIIALVVDANYRNKGIGKLLLSEAENYARNLGATGIGLNSGNRAERVHAHQFYKNMGYVAKSTGFAKSLL